MKTQVDSLSKNQTWDLVPSPQGKNIVKMGLQTKFTFECVFE
jgi:hypothetical protein